MTTKSNEKHLTTEDLKSPLTKQKIYDKIFLEKVKND